jgi:hypothetical protein
MSGKENTSKSTRQRFRIFVFETTGVCVKRSAGVGFFSVAGI